MNDPHRIHISHHRIMLEAGDLLSEHNEDTEWDDAIVTLTTRLLGRPDDERSTVWMEIIRYCARQPDMQANADVVWASLSPAAKATWVETMMPEPPL